jgi:hypothetical protein
VDEIMAYGSEKIREKALTWRVTLAYLLVIAIIQPAIVYNWLVNGLWGLAGLSSWTVILLWAGLTRRLGSPLTSREIFAIRMIDSAGLMYTGYYFAYILRNMYFANSEIAKLFGLQHEVPPFFSPLGEDFLRVSLQRTFFDPSWILPILICIVLPVIFSAIANYVLGLIAYSLYVREEKLVFPYASWDARTMLAFGERDVSRIRIISLAIAGGALYGFMTNVLTTIFGRPLVPRLLIDFTGILENVMPGGAFAFTTDLLSYVTGFILPLKYTALQLFSSVALYVFGNYYVTRNDLWPEECKWQPGRGILWNFNMSTIYFWNSFTIGWGIAAAAIPLIVRYKTVLRAFAGIRRGISDSSESGKWLNAKYLILIYLAIAATSICIVMVLVPGFPLWTLLLFTIGMSFIMTLLQTHSAGIMIGINIPYLRETMIYFSGYRGLDIWFVPSEMMLYLGGSGITQQVLQASMLNVNIKEYTKIYFLLVALGLTGSFIFVSLFWRLYPIPGHAYPYTISAWPVEAMNFWRWQSWLWTGYLFRREWMTTGFGLSAAIYLASDFLLHDASLPIAMIGGMLTPINIALAQFIGSLISILGAKYIGEKFWNENRGFIFIGLTVGDSLVSAFLLIMQLVNRSIWLMPY